MADVLVLIGAGTVRLVGQITVRNTLRALIVIGVLTAGTYATIWLAAAVAGYFLSPSGRTWIMGIGPCF